MAKNSSIIGAAVGRVEGADKVGGTAIYGADVHFADALWGKILRSPYPHARIKNIDTSKAWKVAGVKAIVTGKDEPEHYQGKSIRDIPVCAGTRCFLSATGSLPWRPRIRTPPRKPAA